MASERLALKLAWLDNSTQQLAAQIEGLGDLPDHALARADALLDAALDDVDRLCSVLRLPYARPVAAEAAALERSG